MKIFEFIEKNFQLTEGSSLSIGKAKKIINEDIEFKNEYIVKKTCTSYIDEIKIHNTIATSTCAEILGFDELISTLKLQAPEKEIFMRFISSTSWSGRVYFDESNNFLGYLIGRKKYRLEYSPELGWVRENA